MAGSHSNYYSVLGVDRGVSPADLQKAFRRKAREYHPDINKEPGAEEHFKEVNEAFEVLSDPKRREYYDRYGSMEGYGQGMPDMSDMFDMSDLFSVFFNGGRSSAGAAVHTAGRDMGAQVRISLQEAATGVKKQISYNRLATCESCHGTGAAEGGTTVPCSTCHGTGEVITTQRTILGAMQTRSVCPDCGGTGSVIDKPCPECDGQGRAPARERVNVEIPAGVRDGQQLRIAGRGEAGFRGAAAGNLIVTVVIDDDETFQRHGDDLHVRVELSITQAALGAELSIEGILPDESVEISVAAGSQTDDVIRVRGKGMPRLSRPVRGDLLAHLDVVVPTTLDSRQRELLEELSSTLDGQQDRPRRSPWQRLRDKLS